MPHRQFVMLVDNTAPSVEVDPSSGRPLPPLDAGPGSFTCCAWCSLAEPDERCSNCPRQRPSLARFAAAPQVERMPRKRRPWWWRGRKAMRRKAR